MSLNRCAIRLGATRRATLDTPESSFQGFPKDCQYRLRSGGGAGPMRPWMSQSSGCAHIFIARLAHHACDDLSRFRRSPWCRERRCRDRIFRACPDPRRSRLRDRHGGVAAAARSSRDPLRVDRDGYKLDILACVTLRESGEPRQLVLTWLAPGGPEVEHDDLAAQRGKLLRLAAQILERELRRGFGARDGVSIASAQRMRDFCRRITRSLARTGAYSWRAIRIARRPRHRVCRRPHRERWWCGRGGWP